MPRTSKSVRVRRHKTSENIQRESIENTEADKDDGDTFNTTEQVMQIKTEIEDDYEQQQEFVCYDPDIKVKLEYGDSEETSQLENEYWSVEAGSDVYKLDNEEDTTVHSACYDSENLVFAEPSTVSCIQSEEEYALLQESSCGVFETPQQVSDIENQFSKIPKEEIDENVLVSNQQFINPVNTEDCKSETVLDSVYSGATVKANNSSIKAKIGILRKSSRGKVAIDKVLEQFTGACSSKGIVNAPKRKGCEATTLDFCKVPKCESIHILHDVSSEFDAVFNQRREFSSFEEFNKLFKIFQKRTDTAYRQTRWSSLKTAGFPHLESHLTHFLQAFKYSDCLYRCVLSGKWYQSNEDHELDKRFVPCKCPSFFEIRCDPSQGKLVIKSESLFHNHPLGQFKEEYIAEVEDSVPAGHDPQLHIKPVVKTYTRQKKPMPIILSAVSLAEEKKEEKPHYSQLHIQPVVKTYTRQKKPMPVILSAVSLADEKKEEKSTKPGSLEEVMRLARTIEKTLSKEDITKAYEIVKEEFDDLGSMKREQLISRIFDVIKAEKTRIATEETIVPLEKVILYARKARIGIPEGKVIWYYEKLKSVPGQLEGRKVDEIMKSIFSLHCDQNMVLRISVPVKKTYGRSEKLRAKTSSELSLTQRQESRETFSTNFSEGPCNEIPVYADIPEEMLGLSASNIHNEGNISAMTEIQNHFQEEIGNFDLEQEEGLGSTDMAVNLTGGFKSRLRATEEPSIQSVIDQQFRKLRFVRPAVRIPARALARKPSLPLSHSTPSFEIPTHTYSLRRHRNTHVQKSKVNEACPPSNSTTAYAGCNLAGTATFVPAKVVVKEEQPDDTTELADEPWTSLQVKLEIPEEVKSKICFNMGKGKIKKLTEEELQKRREQKKLSMRRLRDKLKANTEKYEEVKRKEAQRRKATLKKIADLTDQEKRRIRKGWRERARKHRASKKKTEKVLRHLETLPDSPLDDHQILQDQPIASSSRVHLVTGTGGEIGNYLKTN